MTMGVRANGIPRLSICLSDLLFLTFITVLSLTGLVSYDKAGTYYYRYNLLPAGALFDAFIVAYLLAMPATRFTRGALLILTGSSVYMLVSLILLPAPVDGAPTATDIIVAFKPYIYLTLLAFARPSNAGVTLITLVKGFKLLLLAFLLKYLVARVVFDIPRPGLFSENNFELVLLLMLFIFLSRCGQLRSQIWVALLLMVIMLSGSRSALLGLVAALLTSSRSGALRSVVVVMIVPTLLLLVPFVLNTRISGLSDLAQIDRFAFMMLFLEELQNFSPWNYLVGWAPMTPLNNATCGSLLFYSSLFSEGNSYICYPVILHVFYFRMMLDHGILGIVFLTAGFYVVLRSNGLSRSLALALLLQGLINGLSVSGLANSFFVMGIVLVCSHQARMHLFVSKGDGV